MPATARTQVRPRRAPIAIGLAFLVCCLIGAGPFDGFELPDEWEATFWSGPGTDRLAGLDAKALAALVPVQAGLHYCRCPACDADEANDPLGWSLAEPDKLTCRKCRAKLPNDAIPAQVEKKIPEDVVEVRPGILHRYPYHAVPDETERYPDERLYIAAKRDAEARTFLSKAALYAAVRHHERGDKDLARVAAVLILQFAQVYPNYATHFDQPARPKFFQAAALPPPYRRGYATAKWDWSGALDVPLDLAIAFSLIRHDPALAEAGRALGVADPARTIERDLLRASARFVRGQPEEANELALRAQRGVLAVGKILGDDELVGSARAALDRLAAAGFYHDGTWREADPAAQRRVVGLLDGWFGRLLDDPAAPAMFNLARAVDASSRREPTDPGVVLASGATSSAPNGRASLFGGAGRARLAVGEGAAALDLEILAHGQGGGEASRRLAIRIAVGGRTVVGDLDDGPPLADGFERSTVAHNATVVDGLNQRETPALAATRAAGGDLLFFAADPDFQVAAYDDPRAYPRTASRYRHTVVAASSPNSAYALAIFEVRGGLQHDQVVHAAPGLDADWELSTPTRPARGTLLPPGMTYLPASRADDGRWFVQSFGAFNVNARGRLDRPGSATLRPADGPGIRLHLLGDTTGEVALARTPDPTRTSTAEPGRSSLVVRRRSHDGSALATNFVTLYEPVGPQPPFVRVGRVASPSGSIVVLVETTAGTEHLVLNLEPNSKISVRLADGRDLATDGRAIRIAGDAITLAGGTFAEIGRLHVEQARRMGTIIASGRPARPGAAGWFVTDAPMADPADLVGRTLLIRHGDGTARGWTLTRVEPGPDGNALLYVKEETGFSIDPRSGEATYYQFPGSVAPGPHRFAIATTARSR